MALKRAGPLSKGTPQYLEARAPSRTEQREAFGLATGRALADAGRIAVEVDAAALGRAARGLAALDRAAQAATGLAGHVLSDAGEALGADVGGRARVAELGRALGRAGNGSRGVDDLALAIRFVRAGVRIERVAGVHRNAEIAGAFQMTVWVLNLVFADTALTRIARAPIAAAALLVAALVAASVGQAQVAARALGRNGAGVAGTAAARRFTLRG